MSLAAMKNVAPRADLPLVHMHATTNAMPSRNPKPGQPRNLTGLFLGKEVKEKTTLPSPTRRNLPASCQRGRAMPSRRSRTPTEERRYKKVELLRVKEERRGFSGNPVRATQNQSRNTAGSDDSEVAPPEQSLPTDFWDMTRQTTRHFTLTKNAGISHLEYLAPDLQGSRSSHPAAAFDQSLEATLVQEVQQARDQRKEAIGLIHCYNKICKGNRDSLNSLLPHHSHGGATDNFRSTGFSVKSYRSPQKAEILGHFPTPEVSRPRTVDLLLYNRRPLVPSPYFFKTYKSPRPGGPQSLGANIVAIPGAGQLSKTVVRGPPNNTTQVQSGRKESRPAQNKLQEVSMVNLPQAPASTPTPRALHGNKHVQSSERLTSHGKVEISLPSVNKQEASTSCLDTADQGDSNHGKNEAVVENNDEAAAKTESENNERRIDSSVAKDTSSNQGENGIQDNMAEQQGNQGDRVEEGNQDNVPDQDGNQGNRFESQSSQDNPDGSQDNKDGINKPEESQAYPITEGQGHQADVATLPAPEIVIAEADSSENARIANDPLTVSNTEGGQNIQVVMKAENRKAEIAKLMTEHAEIIQEISTAEKKEQGDEGEKNSAPSSDLTSDV